ncbi:MAG: flavodoxin family protein [Syntrophobacteraceae bacterium]|nr:flavodoxin family protein [Syntrophobacteraceae bacterium]
MKVVAFNGSPREDGNTTLLIRCVFHELEAGGIETELVQLSQKKIEGCTACYQCFQSQDGECSLKDDDLNECIRKMVEAQGILLGSPTHFANISSRMKALIDRAGLVALANPGMLRHKVGASVTAANRLGACHTLEAMNRFFFCFEMFLAGSNYPNMALGLEKGEVVKDETGMEAMRVLGINMGLLLKKLYVPEAL